MDKLGFMSAFLTLGEIANDGTREEKCAYDARIIFATMRNMIPEWQAPKGWDELPIEEREKRIVKLKQVIK